MKINLLRLTCDGFDYTVGHLRDLLIYRNTQHLNCDPMQGSGTESNKYLSDVVISPVILFPCAQRELRQINDG